MSPEMIASRRFAQTWRGYDTEEVKEFLAQVAAQQRALRDRCEQAEASRRAAEQRASHPQLDEAALMAAVGEETAGILRSARSAGAEITAKAEANAKATLAAADAKAAELISQAESLLATRSTEAESVAAQIREHALAEAEHVHELAQQQASALLEAAANKAEETVQTAQGLREKILTDLARRRKLGSVQVEQLRAGRERLLDAYLVVRRTLDEVTDELQRADAEARAASDAAARQYGADIGELLEAEDRVRLAVPNGPRAVAAPAAGNAEVRAVATATAKLAPAKLRPPAEAGTKSAEGAVSQAGPGAPAIIAREDVIESVRILRDEPAPIDAGKGQGGASEPGSGASEPGSSASQRDVEGLFARIRASRAEATSTARKALSEVGVGADEDVTAEVVTPGAGPEGAQAGAGSAQAPPETGNASLASSASSLEEFFDRRDELTGPLANALSRKLKRALQDEQNSILDRLRNVKGHVTASAILPNPEEQPDRFVDTARPVLEEAARAGNDLATALFPNASAAEVGPELVDALAEELGRAVAEPLRQRLELAFGSASDDPADTAEAVGPAYREWKTQRVEAIARDQVTAAFSQGSYLAFADRSRLRWAPNPAEVACPDCEDNALAGEQAKGDPWPTGQAFPPAHPGCRCALVPAGAEGPVPAAAGASTTAL